MERIVARRVRDCIEDKLQPRKAGFRPARSTLDTLMQVTSAVRRRKDGEKTAAVFIDYARAFDSVDHDCIVRELLSFGVERHLVAQLAGFLKGRTAQVRVNNGLSEDIGLTCGVPQGSVLGPLLFIVTVDSLSKRLNFIPGLQQGFFADDLTIVSTSADLSEIQQTIQQGLDCITNWSAEYFMEVSAEKTEYTLFGARKLNLLSLKVGETALKEERAPKLLGLTMQPHKGLSKHVMCMKAAANTRLMQLRAVASPEWGPDREKLRAFYLALVQAKMCYGVASWWFETSLSDRERLERVQAQAAHIVAGIPKAANREDALREARLRPINEVAHRRALEYFLRLKAEGQCTGRCRTAFSRPNTQFTSGLRRSTTCTAPLIVRKHHATRRCCSWPGVFTSTSPRWAASRLTHLRRTRRCTPCGACTGSAILTIGCGRAGRWCWMSRQALERRCTRRRVGVRRWCFGLGRLPAVTVRNVWRWKQA
ncbi:putative Reverse transcriptase (RNA dependent DNA polymerase) [Trypanosoma vivax]|nr:putative Reverse transcriptase (RNA dependent DNA polymerase) [Trypanosoma vivax]